jgi:hypothetical protein
MAMTESHPTRHHWFQYGLGAIFLLMAALAAWLGYYASWQRERRIARKWINQRQIEVYGLQLPLEPRPALPWMLRVVGEQPLEVAVVRIDPESEADSRQIEQIKELFPEAHVYQKCD